MAAVLPVRHLVLPRVRTRQNAVAKDSVTIADSSDPKLVSPGDMQLYAYYEPSLKAGPYTITVNQDVILPGSKDGKSQALPGLPLNQQFDVVGPQFSIDPNDFHSFYPPQGHADQPSVLPHVIFNDPHLPWERGMRNTSPISTEQQVPWLAVIPFDCNGLEATPELRLPDNVLNGNSALYKRSDGANIAQTSAFAIQMPLADYFKWSVNPGQASTSKVHIPPFNNDTEYGIFSKVTTSVDVIFLNSTLFKQLFVRNDSSGTPTVDLSQYQYCAHVRNINTQGMADAGVEDTGLFSVVHSLRTGPTDIAQGKPPRSQAVHLVTLEFLDQIQIPPDGEYVALISLYSWVYLCQPPLSVNFVDAMRAIGDQMKEQDACMLRLTNDVIASVSGGPNDPLNKVPQDASLTVMRKYMTDRLNAGYSLIRHRLPSGEPGVALNRSPFAPKVVKHSTQASDWPVNSINGQDYLIFDKYIQAMDVTYSTAWQLGRTLAMADMQFISALGRIRASLQAAGASAGDTAMVNANKKVDITTKAHVLANFANNAQVLSKLSNIEVSTSTPDLRERWIRANGAATALDFTARSPDHPVWQHGFQAGAEAKMQKLAAVKDASPPQGAATTPTISADWASVQDWILDKALFFDSVPWHYLITDPAHLPPESIRFFHIDTIWSDCFIDGALSVANHLSKTDDAIRTAMKSSLNQYLSYSGTGATDHFPQVPVYGFLLRSAVVEVFPDLHITVPFANGVDSHGRQPILVQRNIRKDTLLILLDRLPDDGEIGTIRISQPPHQQRFSAGDYLAGDSIEFMFRKVYPDNTNQTDVLKVFGGPTSWVAPGLDRSTVKGLLAESQAGTGNVYDWNGRCLDFDVLSKNLFNNNNMAGLWSSNLNSAIVGVELNDTLKYLEIKPSASLATLPSELKPPRQIYTGPSASQSMKAKLAVSRDVKPTQLATAALDAPLPTISFALPGKLHRFPSKVNVRSQSVLPSHLNLLDQAPKPAITTATTPIGPGMKQSQFTYAIYPSTTLFDKKYQGKGFITTTTPYPPDLIFSVNLRPPNSVLHGLSLHEVQFRIPIRGKQLRTNPKIDIMGSDGLIPDGTASAGSGARMLSNQRWVVHMDAQPAYLVLRIIPRSMNMTVPIDQNQSLSFRLNEVEISGDDGTKTDQGTVIIQVTEYFGFWQDPVNHTSWSDQGSALTVLVVARTNKTTWP